MLLRGRVSVRALSSTTTPAKPQLSPQEIAAAFQKLGDNLKIPKGNEGNASVFANSQQARDMRDLVKKRHLDQFRGKRFTEVDLQHWFMQMDKNSDDDSHLPDASKEVQTMMKRLHTKYKCVI